MPEDKQRRQVFTAEKIDGGLITNIPSTQVVWSAGRNIAFRVGAAYKIFGKTLLITIPDSLPIRAIFVFRGYDNVWRNIVCCDTKIYSYTNDFTVMQDITPASPPSSTSLDTWTFNVIGGMPILSNGVNTPWKWSDFGSVLTPVSGIPALCKAVHVHNNRVVVGDIQEGAYAFPARIRWSDILDPSDWARDLKLSSGKKDCVNPNTSTEGIDRVQTITNLGSQLVVFSKKNIWFGETAAFPNIYNFTSLDQNIGLIARKGYVKTPNGCYFIGHDNFYKLGTGSDDFLRQGKGAEPIGFPILNSCFPNLNKATIETAYAYYKPSTREVVFCVPTGTNTAPDTAFVYSEDVKAWSIQDIDYNAHSFSFDSSNMQWDTLPYGSWDSITDSSWDAMGRTGVLPYEVVGNSIGQIFKHDSGYNNNGIAIDAFLETGDFVFDNQYQNKIIYEVWPVFKPQASINAVMIQVGTRESLHHDINWSLPSPFTIGVSKKVNVREQGKYIRIRFYSNVTDSPWILEGFGVKFDLGGSR